jgi:hypothetical protein
LIEAWNRPFPRIPYKTLTKMPKQTITLISPHPAEECHRRLEESVEKSFFPIFCDKAVVGTVSNMSFNIRKLKKYRNAFQRILSATYYQTPQGTIINGGFGTHPIVWAILALWYGFIALVVSVLGFLAITDYLKNNHQIDTGALLLILYFFMFALCPVLLAVIGRLLAKDEPALITKFLVDLLDAKELEIPPAAEPDKK